MLEGSSTSQKSWRAKRGAGVCGKRACDGDAGQDVASRPVDGSCGGDDGEGTL